MSELLLKSKDELSEQLVDYIASEVQKITDLTDFEIENYADQEIINPQMQDYLQNMPDDPDGGIQDLERAGEFMSISFVQATSFNAGNAAALFGLRFRKLKRLIRRVFCEVIAPIIGDNGEIDLKDIIKAVLVGLIPALAGTGGIAVALLPLVVVIIAKFAKRGIDSVCPV